MTPSFPSLFELAAGGDRDAIRDLHRSGDRAVFEQARRWALSDDVARQEVGLDVLGQLGIGQTPDRPKWPFRPETIDLLRYLLRDPEAHADVLESAIVAAGHQYAEELLAEVAAAGNHPDDDFRHAVAWGIGFLRSGVDDGTPAPALIVDTLVRLCADDVPAVREWALFALRGIEEDLKPNESPEALAAYLAGVEDDDPEVRAEARQALEALGVRSRSRTPRTARPTTSRRSRRRARRR